MKFTMQFSDLIERGIDGGTEWVLKCRIDEERTGWWVIETWAKPPSVKVIEETKSLILRSMKLYHRRLKDAFQEIGEIESV